MYEPELDKEVEQALQRKGFWDRKLAASILELEQLKSVMTKYKDDQLEMRKRIKKVKKNSKGLLNTIKILDIDPGSLTESEEDVKLDDVNKSSHE
jgi:hypothetical protein